LVTLMGEPEDVNLERAWEVFRSKITQNRSGFAYFEDANPEGTMADRCLGKNCTAIWQSSRVKRRRKRRKLCVTGRPALL
jgi:hypothetical protein